MKKKYVSILISLLIGAILLVWFYQHVGLTSIINQLIKLRYWQIATIFFFSVVIFLITSFRWRFVLESFLGRKLAYHNVAKAMVSAYTVSYLTPIMYLGGEGVRALILKKDINVPLNKSFSSILIDRLSEFTAGFIFLFLSGFLLIIFKNLFWGLFLISLAIFIFFGLYFLIKRRGLNKVCIFFAKLFRLDRVKYNSETAGETTVSERVNFFIKQVEKYLSKSRKKFYLAVIFSLSVWFISIIQLKLLLGYLGFDLSIIKVMIIRVFVVVSGFIPIPARLGAFEGAHILSLKIFNVPANTAIASSLILRIYDVVFISLSIFILAHYLTYSLVKVKNLLLKKYDQ